MPPRIQTIPTASAYASTVKCEHLAAIVVVGALLSACSSTTVARTTTTTTVRPPCETTYPGSPCISTSAPTNTFAPPVPLGTSAHIGDQGFGATVTVSHVMTRVAPSLLFGLKGWSASAAQWASTQKWVGVALTITNTSEVDTFGPTGQESTPAPTYAVNGHALLAESDRQPLWAFEAAVGSIGIAGCPLPAADELAMGTSTSGCIALPNTTDTPITAVGAGITISGYAFGIRYAQWNA
jgi:hypothetical protein